jgi:hypothetical protein
MIIKFATAKTKIALNYIDSSKQLKNANTKTNASTQNVISSIQRIAKMELCAKIYTAANILIRKGKSSSKKFAKKTIAIVTNHTTKMYVNKKSAKTSNAKDFIYLKSVEATEKVLIISPLQNSYQL